MRGVDGKAPRKEQHENSNDLHGRSLQREPRSGRVGSQRKVNVPVAH